jgi:hypothetical protein
MICQLTRNRRFIQSLVADTCSLTVMCIATITIAHVSNKDHENRTVSDRPALIFVFFVEKARGLTQQPQRESHGAWL